jgi:two-component system response regulator YesN
MVVDDEKPAREILSYIIDWKNTDFEITYSASNGKDALDNYSSINPDLIITDIQMPIMDGLSLIEEIKKINKDQKFLILSCYESFTYAQRAMKMGVTDYLIKDLISPNDLYGILSKTKNELESLKRIVVKNNNIKNDSNILSFLHEHKDIALRKLIFNCAKEEEYSNLIENFNLNLKGNIYAIFFIQIDNFYKYMENEDFYIKKLTELIKSINNIIENLNIGESFYSDNGEFTAIVNLPSTNSDAEIINECYSLAQEIKKQASLICDLSLTISISSTFKKLFVIKKYWTEAFKLSKMKVFLGNGKIILNNTFVKNFNFNPNLLDTRMANIIKAIEDHDVIKLKLEITNIYESDLRGFMQFNYLNYINSSLLDLIIKSCTKYTINYTEVFSCSYLPIEILSKKETVEEMCSWFVHVFNKIIEIKVNSCKKSKYSSKVSDAIDYINKNLGNYSLCLTDIARHINVHKVYLCRIFKEETNENVTRYILKTRIDKSKEMMQSTNLKLYEISDNLGFTSPQQFSILFKKIEGVTPNQFRDSKFQ